MELRDLGVGEPYRTAAGTRDAGQFPANADDGPPLQLTDVRVPHLTGVVVAIQARRQPEHALVRSWCREQRRSVPCGHGTGFHLRQLATAVGGTIHTGVVSENAWRRARWLAPVGWLIATSNVLDDTPWSSVPHDLLRAGLILIGAAVGGFGLAAVRRVDASNKLRSKSRMQ